MIITRQRKRRRHLGRFLIPLAIIAVIGFALGFPPTQRIIANGPLHPVWVAGSNAVAVVARPFTFAAQQATIADRNREIRDLNARLEAQRRAKADADERTAQLQRQIVAAQEAPDEATPSPAPRPKPSPAAGFAAAPADAAATHRLAATWAAMEPEKAAAVVQRMPEATAVSVLARMDTDSAGAIMSALPPAAAARISRAQAQVASASGR